MLTIMLGAQSCTRSDVQASTDISAGAEDVQDAIISIEQERDNLRGMDSIVSAKIKDDSTFWHKKSREIDRIKRESNF